jgi:hypothetical protein
MTNQLLLNLLNKEVSRLQMVIEDNTRRVNDLETSQHPAKGSSHDPEPRVQDLALAARRSRLNNPDEVRISSRKNPRRPA